MRCPDPAAPRVAHNTRTIECIPHAYSVECAHDHRPALRHQDHLRSGMLGIGPVFDTGIRQLHPAAQP